MCRKRHRGCCPAPLLERCRPTMVFVEHDEAFRRRIATRTVALDG